MLRAKVQQNATWSCSDGTGLGQLIGMIRLTDKPFITAFINIQNDKVELACSLIPVTMI